MVSYTTEQLDRYFEHISYPKAKHPSDRFKFLVELQQHQLVRVPFESLSLHYSVDKLVSLDPALLYEKIVINSRGGYCLENNKFFAEILKSLGFLVVHTICRVSHATRGIMDGGWRAMSHMVNIVIIDNQRYLVDVGYGADGPSRPLPLVSGRPLKGTPGQELVLERRHLQQHQDPSQQVWVYSQRRGSTPWMEIYHFTDTEFLPADLEILNHYNMTRSFFAEAIVVQRFIFSESEDEEGLSGMVLLLRDQIKRRDSRGESIEVLSSEDERLAALEKVFHIKLTQQQSEAIRGSKSELRLVNGTTGTVN